MPVATPAPTRNLAPYSSRKVMRPLLGILIDKSLPWRLSKLPDILQPAPEH